MHNPETPGFETERYELHTPRAYSFTTDRRDFFKLLGGGLVIALAFTPKATAQRGGQPVPQELGAWLRIDEVGAITVYTGKAEMGQNIRTSLTQAVAEELRTSPAHIQLVMGDTLLTPFDFGTVGSMTTPIMAPQLRKAAATAREMLLDIAAARWNTDRAALIVKDAEVRNPATNIALSFGELTKDKQLAKTIPADAHLTPATEWKIAGHDLSKLNARSIVTGKEKYTSDMKLPGMLYGRVVRPPRFNATLKSVSADGRFIHDGQFLGVVADDPAKLDAAAAAVHAEWTVPPQISSAELFDSLKPPALIIAPVGGDVKIEASYNISYIAHTPLEPRAAVALWEGDKLTVWTGTQRPFGVRTELAQAFGMPETNVRVIVPATGSGYGGKHTGECAVEAARLAKAAGKPVKLQWTREEEFTWAYFRPSGVIAVKAAAGKDGAITGWGFHNFNSGSAALKSPYNIPNQNAQFHEAKYPLRQGSYRGLAASANHFARESAMDELAHEAGLEPAAFRMKNATDPRLRSVIEAATERFRWGQAKTRAGQGFGMMAGFDKGGYVSACVEITVTNKQVKIDRIVQAFECGAIVNPDQLRNQVAGGTMMGIGGALFEAIDFENGKILNARLSKYRVPRFSDMPQIDVVLLDRKDLPSAGAGETPIVAVAPAVANAIFDATGQRLRTMPLKLT